MVNRAVIVKDDFIVYGSSHKLIPSDTEEFTYSACLSAFVASKKEDVMGGTMYLDDAPSSNGAMAIIEAELKKVVYGKPAKTENQIMAIQMLEHVGIETKYNPNIQL